MDFLLIGNDQQSIKYISCCLKMKYPDGDIILIDKIENDSTTVIDKLTYNTPSLIILDIDVDDLSNVNIIEKIRNYSDTPILVLGGSYGDLDRVRGLEAGADDYITKPFNPLEFLARCHALIRRTKLGDLVMSVICCDGVRINSDTHEIFRDNEHIRLTPIEYRLLFELTKKAGLLLPKNELIQKVWGPEYLEDLDLLKTYIYRLRLKLNRLTGKKELIINERGFGYKLVKITSV